MEKKELNKIFQEVFMSDNFAVIGGDLRNIELVKLLAKDQRKIFK
jgi:hypothetical protein